MANSFGDYKNLITELIQKQMDIFGPNIALDLAQQVPGLGVNEAGELQQLSGDGTLILQDLVDSYAVLSVPVTHSVLQRILEKFPTIKKEYHETTLDSSLTCSLFEKPKLQPQ